MDSTASATTQARQAAGHARTGAGSVADVLKLQHPDTWNAVVAKASKQSDTFPDGMCNATEPAYCYVPGEG